MIPEHFQLSNYHLLKFICAESDGSEKLSPRKPKVSFAESHDSVSDYSLSSYESDEFDSDSFDSDMDKTLTATPAEKKTTPKKDLKHGKQMVAC